MLRLLTFPIALCLLAACGGAGPSTTEPAMTTPTEATKPAEAPAEAAASTTPAAPSGPAGSIPGVDYPPQKELGAEVGQLVLGIDPYRLEDIKNQTPYATVSYTDFEVVSKGDFESKFKRVSETTLPNVLTFPLKKGEQVAKGDMVVTWWQGGGGMFHGLVTGGTATEPTVIYTNMASTMGEYGKEFPLKPNSFNKLTEAYQPGSMVAYKADGGTKIGTIVNGNADKLLVTEGSMVGNGILKAIPKAGTVSIPAKPDLKAGDAVFAPFSADFGPGKVTSVDAAKGVVTVKLDFASKGDVTVPWSMVSKTAP